MLPFGFPQADSGGFSSASDGKESACNVGAAGGAGSIPGSGLNLQANSVILKCKLWE